MLAESQKKSTNSTSIKTSYSGPYELHLTGIFIGNMLYMLGSRILTHSMSKFSVLVKDIFFYNFHEKIYISLVGLHHTALDHIQ